MCHDLLPAGERQPGYRGQCFVELVFRATCTLDRQQASLSRAAQV